MHAMDMEVSRLIIKSDRGKGMIPSIITDQVSQDLETALKIITKKGYRNVELHNVFSKSIEACDDIEIKRIKELIHKYDVKVTNIASTVFFLCPLYPKDEVTLFNPEFYTISGTLNNHLEFLKRACHIAHELDCLRIRIFPFRWPDNCKGPYGTKEDKRRILENIKKAVKIAEAYNVVLVLENCPYSHLPKGEMTLEIIQEINNPHLKLLWDPANSYRAIRTNVPKPYLRLNLLSELNKIYPYIEHIHIKDYHYDNSFEKPFIHKPILDGDIDYRKLINELKRNGYKNVISLEPEVNYDDTLICMDRLINIIQ